MTVTVRLVEERDVAELTELQLVNREFLAPWDPARSAAFFTEDHQRRLVGESLTRYEGGATVPLVILESGALVGRINISDIIRGVFQSANLGYWVARSANGRGVATAAVAETVRLAFTEYELHRLQAGTLVHNLASQRVLTRNGFTPIGLAPKYLRIAGRWQDHLLFQRLAHDDEDSEY